MATLRSLAHPIEDTPAALYLRSRGIVSWPTTGLAYLPPLTTHLSDTQRALVGGARYGALMIWAEDRIRIHPTRPPPVRFNGRQYSILRTATISGSRERRNRRGVRRISMIPYGNGVSRPYTMPFPRRSHSRKPRWRPTTARTRTLSEVGHDGPVSAGLEPTGPAPAGEGRVGHSSSAGQRDDRSCLRLNHRNTLRTRAARRPPLCVLCVVPVRTGSGVGLPRPCGVSASSPVSAGVRLHCSPGVTGCRQAIRHPDRPARSPCRP